MTENQLTPAVLGEIEQRAERASKAPWVQRIAPIRGEEIQIFSSPSKIVASLGRIGYEDRDFILAARTDIPLMVQTIRALWAERDKQRAVVEVARKVDARLTLQKKHMSCPVCGAYPRNEHGESCVAKRLHEALQAPPEQEQGNG